MKTSAIFFATTISFFFSTSFAQNGPPKEWDVRFGGTDNDFMRYLQQTSDDGYILGGESVSGIGGDKTQASQGGYDYWIVKTDADGVKQWDARFGGSTDESFFCMQQTSDNGYILGGESSSGISGDKTQTSQGGTDYWIVKTDVNGVKQWDARFGGNAQERLFSLHQTTDGGYILGGQSSSGISGDKTQASQGGPDYWIVKTDANGIKQWDARFGGSGDDILFSVKQTADGGYILGGHSNSGISGDKTQASQGLNDYWIVKTDSDGIKQWDVRFGGIKDEQFHALQLTTDGGYILGGISYSGISGDKTQDNWGPSYTGDYWMVKIDENGVKQWDARFGGTSGELFEDIQQTNDGGYVLGGGSPSPISGDKTQESQGVIDYWIVKTDSNGQKEWDARYGGLDYENFFSLEQISDSSYILGGYTNSDSTGDMTQSSRGMYDFWIVKLSSEIPTNVIAPVGGTISSFEVYGNPFSNSTTISFSLQENTCVNIRLFDLAGRNIRTVLDQNLDSGNHELTFNRESITAGIYFLEVKTDEGVMTKKLVIE